MLISVFGAAILAVSSVASPTSGLPGQSSRANFSELAPLTAADLGEQRAGQGETYAAISAQTLSALNSGNSVNANTVNSGSVDLQSGAFSGYSGLGNFVINTGNNNNLQGALNVTILMVPAITK